MTLPSWWQVTTLHKDIREKRLTEAIFAADLGDVYYEKAPTEYQDASIFFQKTYLTQGLKNILGNVLSRLSSGKGDPVIQLQTPFGGGKTHALLALYHAVKNREKVKHLEVISQLPQPKNAMIAVFAGTYPDPIKGRTPWGEIAHQLGVYEKVKEHDEKRRSPGKEILDDILGENPVLILMDELVQYAVKAKDFSDQISAFSQEITELVKSKDNCCLICTLPSSAPYGEEGERALSELQRIYGRVEAVYTPVEGVEIYEVIRKRLFDDFGDEKIRKDVAQTYFNLYQKLGSDVPVEVREIEYREHLEHAYPFHPELIDVLYERWGSYPTFQRTRGVLRLLAEVVADLYNKKITMPLIQSSLVNLGNQAIRREFIKHIGNEFEAVIASDIASQNAKAPKIDKEMGSEYEKYGIASGIATSVFLYSFSGAEKKETSLPRVRVALLRENIPHIIVGDAISKLEEELWYFHSEKRQYSFRNQPNLNRVILEREETVSDEKIREELKGITKRNTGKALEVYLWPENSSDIPDNKNLKLAILSPELSHDSEKGKKLVAEFYEKAGIGFRVYKNTLFMLAIDRTQYTTLSKSLRHFIALSDLLTDKGLLGTLTKESREELKRKLKDVEKEVPFRILTVFRKLAVLEEKGLNWKDLGIPTVGMGASISERVKQYLIDLEKILSAISPRVILDKTFAKNESEKLLGDIAELFLKTPGMPIPEKIDILFDAAKEGVKSGLIGVREGAGVYYKQEVSPTIDSVLLRSEVAEKEKEREAEEEEVKEEKKKKEEVVVEEEVVKTGIVKRVTFVAKIPWDKLSYIIAGVIRPLKDKGSSPEITVKIESEGEFDRTTLDTKVKETLQQIGAEIEEWKED